MTQALALKVKEAFAAQHVGPAVDILFATFWEPTETSAETARLLQCADAQLIVDGSRKEAEFCASLCEALLVERKLGDIAPAWFVAEILRITGWTKNNPTPTAYAENYILQKGLRRVLGGNEMQQRLLQAILSDPGPFAPRQRSAAAAARARRGRFWRKAACIAAAPLTGGASLLHLTLEDDN